MGGNYHINYLTEYNLYMDITEYNLYMDIIEYNLYIDINSVPIQCKDHLIKKRRRLIWEDSKKQNCPRKHKKKTNNKSIKRRNFIYSNFVQSTERQIEFKKGS